MYYRYVNYISCNMRQRAGLKFLYLPMVSPSASKIKSELVSMYRMLDNKRMREGTHTHTHTLL